MKNENLNANAGRLVDALVAHAATVGVAVHDLPCGARLVDCGVAVAGSIAAGEMLARICLADLGKVFLSEGTRWSLAKTHTDQPWLACLASQFGGWKLSAGKFFAIGSGPMRAAAAHEPIFAKLGHSETAERVVGVLEAGKLPPTEVVEEIAAKCRVEPAAITLAVAPTASVAGTFQVVARVVETALHKLFELGFDVKRIESAQGSAPLPPVAPDDVTAIGWTNDAILYGGDVTLWTTASDAEIERLGPQVPSSASPMHGQPFAEVFKAAGGDFYKIDPLLFSPARVTFRSLAGGRDLQFGTLDFGILERSFGGSGR